MTKAANYQDLLKTIAVVAMIIDHLGLYLFPDILELRVIGRYVMPIFAFFAGYNFKNQINLSVLFAGALLYIISTIFIFHDLLEMNILISIFLGQIYLYLFREHFKNFNKGYFHFIILASLWPWTKDIIDYGTVVIGLMVIGYMTKIRIMNPSPAAFVVAFISMLHTSITFYGFFTNRDLVIAALVAVFIYLSINHAKFEQHIPVNLKIISRNSMLIYCVHVVVIQFVWRYYTY